MWHSVALIWFQRQNLVSLSYFILLSQGPIQSLSAQILDNEWEKGKNIADTNILSQGCITLIEVLAYYRHIVEILGQGSANVLNRGLVHCPSNPMRRG